MRQLTQIGIATSVLLLLLVGCQEATSPGDTTESSDDTITISDAWVRAMEDGNSAAYMTIQNNSDDDITLTEASADFANMTQIHQTTIEDDVARMQEVEGGLTIPAGESVNLEPGGYHVMLMDLQEPLVEGNDALLTLTFDNGDVQTVNLPIRTEAPRS
jgi:hypothetical protein